MRRGRRHKAENRQAIDDDGEVDGEFVAAGDQFPGPVERIDEDEGGFQARHGQRRVHALLRDHRDARQQTRQSFEEDRLSGLISIRDRRVVLLQPRGQARAQNCQNPVRRLGNQIAQCCDKPRLHERISLGTARHVIRPASW